MVLHSLKSLNELNIGIFPRDTVWLDQEETLFLIPSEFTFQKFAVIQENRPGLFEEHPLSFRMHVNRKKVFQSYENPPYS